MIAFDCDSTLSSIEGIEELAGPHREEIRRITDAAMSGAITVEEVYASRLALVRPTRQAVEQLGLRYVESLLPNVAALVHSLSWLEKRVCIITGGLEPAILHAARAIGVLAQDVFAMKIFHDEAGEYAGFDEGSPLARSGGKLEIATVLAKGASGAGGLAFVGDGVTDLETQPVCSRFVAFGGVARREAVFAAADERAWTAALPLCSARQSQLPAARAAGARR